MRAALVGYVDEAEARGVAADQPHGCSRHTKAEHRCNRKSGDHEALRWATTSRAAVAKIFFVLNPSSRSILPAL